VLAAPDRRTGNRRMGWRRNHDAKCITAVEKCIQRLECAYTEVAADLCRPISVRIEESRALRAVDRSKPSDVMNAKRTRAGYANADWRGQTTTPRALSSRNARKC
jgi:hypothetical protein